MRAYLGYKVNIDKTMTMDFAGGAVRIPQTFKLQTGFKWPENGIKYLGIQISS